MSDLDVTRIASFGGVAAEDEPVLDYFLSTPAHAAVADGRSLLVLGRKGSGKTALVRHFAETESTNILSRSLSFKSYPWSVHAARIDAGASTSEAYIAAWSLFLSIELAVMAYKLCPDKSMPVAKRIASFLKANYGTDNPQSADLLVPDRIRLEGTFEPQVLGSKLGALSLKREARDFRLKAETQAVSDALLGAVAEIWNTHLSDDVLLLHLDELDQGLSTLDDQRRGMMIGLILAARSIRLHFLQSKLRVSPVIYLRTDLWDELQFSDKNKIAESLSWRISWDEGSLQELIELRASKALEQKVSWGDLEDGQLMRGSQAKWRHMVARTYLRPRDAIKFCNEVLDEAKKRIGGPRRITNEDVTSARDAYSRYLKNELDDEILAHWPTWHQALEALSSIQTLTFAAEEFEAAYGARRSGGSPDPRAALELLYAFSVIGWERRSGYGGSSWVFRHEEPDSRLDPSASRFKTHLGLKEYCRLKEERI